MKTEKELLEMFGNYDFNIYKMNNEAKMTNSIQLVSIEELIDFSNKHNINTMFYCYQNIDKDNLEIDDEVTSKVRLDGDQLSVLQDKFDEYNERLSELDYSKPIYLNVYCIYQGVIFFIEEEDYWFIEEGFGMPERICMELATEHLEDIIEQKEKTREKIVEGRNELRKQMLNDLEFQKCTNIRLRRSYADRIFSNNKTYPYQKLFYSNRGGLIDITILEFVEEVWREYKNSLKK